MKVTLLMATTLNGFIADPQDDTNWVKDLDALDQKVADFGIVIMGKRTYEESLAVDAFPYKGAVNIVMTHDSSLIEKSNDQVIFSAATPTEIIELCKKKGFAEVLVIGGGHTNAAFLKEMLFDEIIIDIHPMIMANGIKLFEGDFDYKDLELVDHKEMNDQILQVTYRLKK